jgi:hypothetical protein
MWRLLWFAFGGLLVACSASGSSSSHLRRVNEDEALDRALSSLVEIETGPESHVPVGKLSDFGYELGISVDSTLDERDGVLIAKVFVFNRADRTWVLKTSAGSFGARLRDPARDLEINASSPATSRCAQRPESDLIVVGPGERRPVGCFEASIASGIDEVEILAELHFRAVDGASVHLLSPPFRIARHVVNQNEKNAVKARHTQ